MGPQRFALNHAINAQLGDLYFVATAFSQFIYGRGETFL